jgi:hypothetical protein
MLIDTAVKARAAHAARAQACTVLEEGRFVRRFTM